MPLPDDVPLVIEPAKKYLNQRQVEDYKQHRRGVLEWLWALGKDPERGEGYGPNTHRARCFPRTGTSRSCDGRLRPFEVRPRLPSRNLAPLDATDRPGGRMGARGAGYDCTSHY
jgi:hypothetical protein